MRFRLIFIFFACGYPIAPAPFVENTVLSPLKLFWCPHQNSIGGHDWSNWAHEGLFLDCQFYFTDLYVFPYVITTPVLIVQLCQEFWNWDMWVLQLLSCSTLCWPFWVSWISMWILGSACQFLQRSHLVFCQELSQ